MAYAVPQKRLIAFAMSLGMYRFCGILNPNASLMQGVQMRSQWGESGVQGYSPTAKIRSLSALQASLQIFAGF